jgi:hypothetical protein
MISENGFNPDMRRPAFVLNNTEINYAKSVQGEMRSAIDPTKFKDYDQGMIAADMQSVIEAKKKFNDSPEDLERKRLSDATEHLVQDQIESNDWFGPDVLMIASSEYDDIFKGFDAFVEFQDVSHLGLALDFTFSAKPEEKYNRIKTEIDRTNPPSAKYFESKHIVGRLKSVVRCVIEVDREVIDDIMSRELQLQHYRRTGDRESIRKTNRELESHPLQLDLLEQLLAQLKTYKEYAIKNQKQAFVELYQLIERNVRKIYQSKLKWLQENPAVRESMDAQRAKVPIHGKTKVDKMLAGIFN